MMAVAGPVGLYGWWFPRELSDTTEAWAHFGDYFGGVVGTLFAIAGFVFLILSFRRQLRDSYRAGFEETLFRMVDFQWQLLASLQPASPAPEARGYDELMRFYREIDRQILPFVNQLLESIPGRAVNLVQGSFARIYRRGFFHLGHYFRHLYWIFRFIDESQLSFGERSIYAKIVRARLSPAEIILLGLNGMTPDGTKFRNYVIKYALLHPRHKGSAYYRLFERHYPQETFGDDDAPPPPQPEPRS